MAATSAFAQSVTLYGLIDVGYGAKQIEGNTGLVSTGKQTGVMDGGWAGNRIGFKGTEDLGGGQTAGFVIEQGISPTNGALFGVRTANAGFQLDGLAGSTGKFDQGTGGGYSQGTNRQTFASFADKKFGEVRIGYQYTTLYEVSTLDGYTTLSEGVIGGSNTHVFGQGTVGGTRANGITYISPRVSSFGATVQVGSAGGRDTTESVANNAATGLTQDRNKRFSLKLDYAEGPWKAAFNQTSFQSSQSARAANANTAPATTYTVSSLSANPLITTFNVYGALTSLGSSPLNATSFDSKLNQIAGSYTASNWKVGYQRNSGTMTLTGDVSGATNWFGTAVSTASGNKPGTYQLKSQRLSGQYSIGALDLLAGQGTATVDVDGDAVRAVDFKEKQIGAIYNASKTTRLYAYNGQWTNDAAAVAGATKAYKGKQTIVGIAKSF